MRSAERARSVSPQAREDGLAPTMMEIWASAGLIVFYLLARELFGANAYLTASMTGPVIMTAILGYGAWRMLAADGRNIWTALFWFRLSTAVYFGFGTYAVFIANNTTRLYIEAFHRFFDEEIFKMNLIVACSVLLVLVAAKLAIAAHGLVSPRRAAPAEPPSAGADSLLTIGAIFTVVGLVVTYGLRVPLEFGWIKNDSLGSILGLSRFTPVGIFMLTLWSLQRGSWFLPVITAITVGEMLFQLMLFQKAGVLMTLMLYLLAFLWRRLSLTRVLLCAVLVAASYVAIQPVVSYARDEHRLRYATDPQIGFRKRFDILVSYTPANAAAISDTGDLQGALSRVSYVNAATFVIHQYDDGYPATWPRLLPAVFVPRLLWPDKPIISDIGKDIYELSTGSRTSSAGAGVFADAYWAMGWGGVALYMPIYGAILGALSVAAAGFLRRSQWLFFPVVLMGLLIGSRTDGHYITDVAGAAVIVVGLYLVLAVADLLIRAALPAPGPSPLPRGHARPASPRSQAWRPRRNPAQRIP